MDRSEADMDRPTRIEFKHSLYNLDPPEFESLVAEIWSRRGWNATVTQLSGDSGIDIVATRDSPFPQKQLIQVKRYGPDSSVSSPEIQQYASLRQQEDNVDSVVVVTSSRFSKPATALAGKLNVKLVDSGELYDVIDEGDLFDVLDGYLGSQTETRSVPDEPRTTDPPESSVEPFGSSVTPRWTFETDGLYKPPAIKSGTIYIGSEDGHLYALETGAGIERWSADLQTHPRSSPAVSDDAVFVGCVDYHAYALDADSGAGRWVFRTSAQVVSVIEEDRVVYLKVVDPSHCRVYAVDASSGDERWSLETEGDRGGNVLGDLTVAGDSIYFGVNNQLYAVDSETGEERWRFEAGDQVMSTPAVYEGSVYVGSWDNCLYAIHARDGIEEWSFETGDSINSSPTVINGTVYVGSNDRHVYAVDCTGGSERWSFRTKGIVPTSPAVTDETVYVGSWDQSVYALNADEGTREWTFETGDEALSPTVVDQTVYVSTDSGDVFALEAG